MATETAKSTLNEPLFEGHGKENGIDRTSSTQSLQEEVQESQTQALPVEYPTPLRQVLITFGLMLGMFLVRRLLRNLKQRSITDLLS